jgi:uncharacterized protein YkwD
MRTAPIRVPALGIALGLATLVAGPAAAQAGGDLPALINAYRSQAQACHGSATAAAEPLKADPALQGIAMGPKVDLMAALKQRGYAAAQAHAIVVSGPASASAAMELLRDSYCEQLSSTRFVHIGVTRQGNTWSVILAQPLLTPGLGDWAQAGHEILKLTNAARAQPRRCGARNFGPAPPVHWNAQLAAAALAHSRDMANSSNLSHRGSDGTQVAERVSREGYRWREVGENIASGQGAAEQAVAGWLASPPHCEAIMTPGFVEMGAAYAIQPQSEATIYWTQVFGTPR